MSRSTWTLLAILLLLIGLAVIIVQRPGERPRSDVTEVMLVSFDSSAVNHIEVHSADGTITLQKDNGVWMLASPIRYRADPTAVETAIGKARAIPVKSVVSSNADKYSLFKVDSSGTSLRLYSGNTLLASIYIGKLSSTYNETYVRKDGATDVILADGMFEYIFSKPLKDWRDKSIIAIKRDEIQRVRFVYGDTTFALARVDSGWTLDGVKAAGAPIERLMGALGGFTADGFIDSTFVTAGKATSVISVNGIDLRFFKQTGNYAVQGSISPQWFVVNDWKAQSVLKRKAEFISPSSSSLP